MTATTRLAEFVVKTSLRECPDAVLAQTRRAVLDTIGVMLAGMDRDVDHRHAGLRRRGGATAWPGRDADAPRARHRGLARLRAQGKLRLDDEALSRGPRGAERIARRAARP